MAFLLPNYVRSHRKRWHLSQREAAFLLGMSSQQAISQHEALVRMPQAKALLKYEALFGEAIGDIFPKLRDEAECEVLAQAKLLMERMEGRAGLSVARKLELLTALIRRLES